MDDFRAAMIAEGVWQAESEDEYLEAWQHLVNSGHAFRLQGWFGRCARDLIASGAILSPADEETEQ
jgi:hypothetical protein